jgi:hypothetical protein
MMKDQSYTQQQPIQLQTLDHVSYTNDQTPGLESLGYNNAPASMCNAKSMGVTVGVDPAAKLQPGRFDNEKLDLFKLASDFLVVLLPIGLLAFMIAIWRLDGKEVDQEVFSTWRDSINVVSVTRPSVCPRIHGD